VTLWRQLTIILEVFVRESKGLNKGRVLFQLKPSECINKQRKISLFMMTFTYLGGNFMNQKYILHAKDRKRGKGRE
jgi:hypothetical protein